MKMIQTDLSDFEKIINRGFLYIDKTEYIHKLLTVGSYYFLAHPRRFGKSLLISTLYYIFKGRRDLFEGLWIATNTDYDWQKYPIIFLDFGNIENETSEIFKQAIYRELYSIGAEYDIQLSGVLLTPGDVFKELCRKLFDKYGSVVVLVDEYDKGMLDHIDNLEIANENQKVLKSLFSMLKSLQNNIKYVFVTGVSRFARTSVFSGGNNLRIVTEEDTFDGLLGITQKELKCLEPYFEKLGRNTSMNAQEICTQFQMRYNGYQFSKRPCTVYNPFSVFRALITGELESYWFASGTPTFLVKYIKKHHWSFDGNILEDLNNNINATKTDVSGLREISDLKFIPILFETGYLTIKSYDALSTNYTLAYPNLEVREAFLQLFCNTNCRIRWW